MTWKTLDCYDFQGSWKCPRPPNIIICRPSSLPPTFPAFDAQMWQYIVNLASLTLVWTGLQNMFLVTKAQPDWLLGWLVGWRAGRPTRSLAGGVDCLSYQRTVCLGWWNPDPYTLSNTLRIQDVNVGIQDVNVNVESHPLIHVTNLVFSRLFVLRFLLRFLPMSFRHFS